MSASLDHSGAALDALLASLEAAERKSGRLEFANEVAKWAVANRDALPPHLRTELASLIMKAGE